MKRAAGYIYTVLTAGVVVFQLALASGAPWGSYAMGGTDSGEYTAALRVLAVVQVVVLILLALVVLSRAGIVLPRWSHVSRWAIWVVVAWCVVSLFLNLITPSAGERAIWAPVAFVMLVASLLVAIGKPAPQKALPDKTPRKRYRGFESTLLRFRKPGIACWNPAEEAGFPRLSGEFGGNSVANSQPQNVQSLSCFGVFRLGYYLPRTAKPCVQQFQGCPERVFSI